MNDYIEFASLGILQRYDSNLAQYLLTKRGMSLWVNAKLIIFQNRIVFARYMLSNCIDYRLHNTALNRLSLPNPLNYVDLEVFSVDLVNSYNSSLEVLGDGRIVYSCCGWS